MMKRLLGAPVLVLVLVECGRAANALRFGALSFQILELEKLEYGECTAFGSTAKVSTGAFEINATSSLTLLKAITIESEASECSIVFGSKGEHFSESIRHENHAKKVKIELSLSGIPYSGTGGVCGGTGSEGQYVGTLEVQEEGGTIEWR